MMEETRRKWIDALRSGHYPQTTGRLRDMNGYCCLGVLADVVDPDGWVEPEPDVFDIDAHVSYEWHGCEGQLDGEEDDIPAEARVPINTQNTLVGFNDQDLYDFGRIADWVEQNPNLFVSS